MEITCKTCGDAFTTIAELREHTRRVGADPDGNCPPPALIVERCTLQTVLGLELERVDAETAGEVRAWAAKHGLELVPRRLVDDAAENAFEVAKDIADSYAKLVELAKRVRRLAIELSVLERRHVLDELYAIADELEEL